VNSGDHTSNGTIPSPARGGWSPVEALGAADVDAAGPAGLEEVFAEYLLAAEAGAAPDREQLISLRPDLADELRAFFEDEERIDRLTRSVRPPDAAGATDGQTREDSTLGDDPCPGPAAGAPPRVRYFGEYELLEEIGRGGMGVVYKARQIKLNRVVALKMILAGQFASAEDVKRFQVEAQNAARLDHPNIVPVYEVGRHRGQHYFTMKLIAGGSLARQAGRFVKEPRRAAQLIATAARAVHHAHQHGILHRDIKPGNILLDGEGRPQVTDFGLARRIEGEEGLTLPGAVLGSPRYMAPEQARGEKDLSVAADVYALGAVLYELLTGRPPFTGPNALETLRQVREQEPARPSAIEPALDAELETVSLKCLEKNPQRRYGSALAVAEDVERWLRSEPILARPINRARRTWRWCRRNPALAALSALLVLGSTVGTTGVTALWLRAENAKSEATRHKRIAEDALADSEAANAFIVGSFNSSGPDLLARATFDLDTGLLRHRPATEAAVRHTIGEAYRARGEWDLAETQLRAAFDARVRLFGRDHWKTANSRTALASVLHAKGDLDGAEGLYREALAIETSGQTHSTVSWYRLWAVLRDKGDRRGMDALQGK
jgi:serine/threonine protein kinase